MRNFKGVWRSAKTNTQKVQDGDDIINKLAVISMYDEKVLIADRLFRKREYQEAIISYNNALEHLNNKSSEKE